MDQAKAKDEDQKCKGGMCKIDVKNSGEVSSVELEVSEWLNTNGKEIKLTDLKGKVVLVEAFQMLCPGCINHGLPQINRLHSIFRNEDEVFIIGLHSVFEHHEAMQKESLEAFLSEFRYNFPVAIDEHKDGSALPETMKKFGLNGTPSLIIIDKKGELREILFGAVDDLVLGLKVGKLLRE